MTNELGHGFNLPVTMEVGWGLGRGGRRKEIGLFDLLFFPFLVSFPKAIKVWVTAKKTKKLTRIFLRPGR